ncbi:MAG: ABC transporter ATP-binding protein [Proteobacteria bacterium]|nr:ABC transporter ATP-binding protein [Pseudomonadota bacterium]
MRILIAHRGELLPPKTKTMNDNQPILAVSGLTKKFGDFYAVDDVNFSVKPGTIFGFLGPNGAGKTTTIKMLAGLLQPDSGTITIGGHLMASEPLACKQITGYIPDRPYLYEKLTGHEFLQFMASLYDLSAEHFATSARYLKLFDLDNWQHHLVESYSHGMRQKLIMTSAFMLDSPLIVVDEPMVGLDPKSARLVKGLFKEQAAKGRAIFLSTHSLEIAEELCDTIAIIVEGRLRSMGSLKDLRNQSKMADSDLEEIFLELTGAYELQEVVKALKGAIL